MVSRLHRKLCNVTGQKLIGIFCAAFVTNAGFCEQVANLQIANHNSLCGLSKHNLSFMHLAGFEPKILVVLLLLKNDLSVLLLKYFLLK